MPRYRTKLKPKKKKSLASLWLVMAGLGLVGIAVWAVLGGNAQAKANIEVTGEPRLEVSDDFIDRGDIKFFTTIRDDIQITNVGDKPLRFIEAPYIEVEEGCCPPTPSIGAMVLQPGKSTVVSLEYMMHGKMGGKHDFRVTLKTNDPTQPVKEVQILSNWIP